MHRLDVEIGLGSDLAEEVDVAVTVPPEVEVLADHDHPRLQALHQHAVDERLGALGGLFGVERHDDDGIEARRRKEFHLLIGARQQTGGRFGAHHAGGMAIEGDDDRLRPNLGGPATNLVDDSAVTEVNAVVCANRDHRTLVRPRAVLEVGHDAHGRKAIGRRGDPPGRRGQWGRTTAGLAWPRNSS